MLFGAELTIALGGATEYGQCSDGVNVWVAWIDPGTGSVKVIKSTNQGYALSTAGAVTVDTNANNSHVILNDPFVRDPDTGALHLVWNRHEGAAGAPCELWYSTSTNDGASWSAAAQLDPGTLHGNNQFYRVGVCAKNGVVVVLYDAENVSTFITDGFIWCVQSLDGGTTWSSPAKLYASGTTNPYEPNAVLGEDGSIHLSFYDPGVLSNLGGDLFYVRGTWSAAGYTWPATITQVTSGQTCGRPRPTASNGVVMIVTNTNFGGASADVSTVRSTDNGDTWGAITNQATHTTNALDHPAILLGSDHGIMIWVDFANSPRTYGCKLTTDGGATWATGPTPLVTTGSSDAPKLLATNDLVLAMGNDGTASTMIYRPLPLFSPDPASAPIVDNFNRANETPVSDGGKWTLDTIGGPSALPKLVSDQIIRNASGGSFDRAGGYRNDVTVTGGLGEVYGTVGSDGGSNGEIDLLLGDESTKNAYRTTISAGDFTNGATLQKVTAGTGSTILSSSTPLTTGDKWSIRVTPNDVVVLRFINASSDWQEQFRTRDTTFRTDFRLATNIAGVTGVPALDDFGGGTLVPPSNSVAPVATGTVGSGNTLSVGKGTWATANGATPARYSYQWQTSPAGTDTWTDIDLATLPFMTVADATKDHRCVVTASNSYGSASADSNTLSAPSSGTVQRRSLSALGTRTGSRQLQHAA